MKLIKLFAGAAILAFVQPSSSNADSYFLNITELSDTQISVTGNFPANGSLTGIYTNPAGDSWTILNQGNVTQPGLGPNGGTWTSNGFSYLGEVMWIEPNSNPLNPSYNVLSFGYQPSGYNGEHIFFFSDLTASDIEGRPGLTWGFGCGLGGADPCPQYSDGTPVTIPLSQAYNAIFVGNWVVTVTDQGDVAATPLPSTWLMLLSGFVGLGYFAYRGTKKRTDALAAA